MARKASVTPDDNAPELTGAQLAEMRPAREVLNPQQFEAVTSVRRGRPKAQAPKVPVTIRIDADVVETYKATGDGWQTRMNECLSRGAQKLRAAPKSRSSEAGKRSSPKARLGGKAKAG
ncbi:BrnA antitoxin family protein [Methylorubrum populi]|jgi:uncharacterized protein (DUF4415 family)|uniref:BrnA antitoxin family protein n=1 Tax=Methylorubrum rhodesianum TaxID=29427 RepID=A0ABU9Z7Y7_9HYPH|nr:BrnA antitoxin family protein [Methylorubrum rhodesianum]MBK3406497.1 BrnA antitoxin family protein [Methylorubrum rhodesianum]MBY0139569.1 BrnA antitoxin family protein [Methylorubrum populi]